MCEWHEPCVLRSMKPFRRFLLLAALASSPVLLAGCEPEPTADVSDITQKSSVGVDVAALGGLYGKTFASFEDSQTVKVKAGEITVPAPTHLFGAEVNIVAYSNDDGVKAADGTLFERGDSEIAKVFKRGQVGIAVKNHRAKLDVLDLSSTDPTAMKEHFKLQDTHIGIVVGVERDGQPGASSSARSAGSRPLG
jgi:hypothetical protein